MGVGENEALVRRWLDGINAGRAETSAALLAADYRMNGQPLGNEGAGRYSAMLLVAFPDWHADIEELVAAGDRVAVRLTYTGTHRGDLTLPPVGRIAPTGTRIAVTSVELYRVVDGRIAESWVGSDRLGLLQQLGATIAPPAAPS